MKTLLITLRENNSERTETYVLDGDRRQSNERMIQRGLAKLVDEPVEFVDEEKRHYRTVDTDRDFTIEEARLLEEDEAEEMRRKHFTLVINENVTEEACRVRYS